MNSESRKILYVLAVLALALVVVPLTGSYIQLLATQVLIFSILTMSVDLLLGYTGLPSLGQAAYLGMGAYLTAILATRLEFGLGCDFGVAMVLGILIGAATAAFFGLFALRATGVFFLIITLALGMVVWGLAYRWNSMTGGDNGINVFSRPVCGVDLAGDTVFFYFCFVFFFATLAGLYLLVRSPFGRSLVGIRESEERMKMLGYNTWLHKYLAFVIAGGIAGLAGTLWTHLNGIVSPEDVVLATSVDALLVVVLGGPGTLVGAIVGAVMVVFVREYLSTLVPWWQYLLGGVYVLTILFLPGGMMGIRAQYRKWRMARPSAGSLATTDSA
ncbi:MAG: branched-chain amino acid ABC transporter permease [bacterium]